MGYTKTSLCLVMSCVCLWLTGCQQKTLAQREIVRAVFLEQQETECKAVLLVEDTDLPEGESGYKTADAAAPTFEKAIREAELSLDGTPFYGLMDLVGLPIDADWETVTQIGTLLYQQAQPAPEMNLFLLDPEGNPLPKSSEQLYETMKAEAKILDLQVGLEELFTQQDFCALPVWQDDELGFAFLKGEQDPVVCIQGLESQLAAALCGQLQHLESYYAQNTAYCSANVSVEWDARQDGIHIFLRLRQTTLQDLSGQNASQENLTKLLQDDLQTAFTNLNHAASVLSADPFRLLFWQESVLGITGSKPVPGLQIEIEP